MPRLPRNSDVAAQLDLLGDLLELEGEPAFRVLAYRRAANRVRETSGSIAELAVDGKAKELGGIGKTIEEKIVQIVDDGEIHALTKRRAQIPPEVVLFLRLPGLGPKTAARIWKELGVTTLAELKEAAEQQQEIFLTQARATLRAETEQARQQLRQEVADLAVNAASKIVRKELDPATQARLIQETLSEASGSNPVA